MSLAARLSLRRAFMAAALVGAVFGATIAVPADAQTVTDAVPDTNQASAAGASATEAQPAAAQSATQTAAQDRIVCESREGQRQYCPAVTSARHTSGAALRAASMHSRRLSEIRSIPCTAVP